MLENIHRRNGAQTGWPTGLANNSEMLKLTIKTLLNQSRDISTFHTTLKSTWRFLDVIETVGPLAVQGLAFLKSPHTFQIKRRLTINLRFQNIPPCLEKRACYRVLKSKIVWMESTNRNENRLSTRRNMLQWTFVIYVNPWPSLYNMGLVASC